ncbi:MAG TPA: hypothetical protein VFG33_05985 [Kribbella sp.]|uniref:hypothetical protein n=1 Tax=Kribbella sp. TaxID=1871183 RepID=UPI002D7964AA|nr:hypothetical protein [Kribbella sp.]HET6292900.1 hypothetical protein [Kribbella sp.]
MATVWTEWGALTRFLQSARLAFARERSLWHSLELADPDAVMITSMNGASRYEVSLSQHVSAVDDEVTLHASVLIHYYALAEAAACAHLSIDARNAGGIEAWGNQLLIANGRDWSDVLDGRAGAVELAVVRNAFAHGTRLVSDSGATRLSAAGSPPRLACDPVTLTYQEVILYRDRLKSLLRSGAVDPKSAQPAVKEPEIDSGV